eukprot:CAMPEP_0203944478 /NCGR_PEP_ID=MMETSP0359-20131031/80223_1 /ASSEMBLY_ACC=CAM_ASM_000338 /TAXON_ID=268821 /ORGANISM="Scrippsiella Hangoei, Strain SHTV-5" /LENGTH=60 /DNA_ID=CAMNT_0050875499 /DNA_START=83 /DNA_END=263 /DNA_ORIENTATION=+
MEKAGKSRMAHAEEWNAQLCNLVAEGLGGYPGHPSESSPGYAQSSISDTMGPIGATGGVN